MLSKKVLLVTMMILSFGVAEARPLSEVQSSGILKIGVPGDYAPLAFYKNNALIGYHIDVANAVAKNWNIQLEFVPTSWSNLAADLEADKFDTAMGGISFTKNRDERFLSSQMAKLQWHNVKKQKI